MLSVEPHLASLVEEIQQNLQAADDGVDAGGCCHDCESGGRYYDELTALRDLVREYPQVRGLIWYDDPLLR